MEEFRDHKKKHSKEIEARPTPVKKSWLLDLFCCSHWFRKITKSWYFGIYLLNRKLYHYGAKNLSPAAVLKATYSFNDLKLVLTIPIKFERTPLSLSLKILKILLPLLSSLLIIVGSFLAFVLSIRDSGGLITDSLGGIIQTGLNTVDFVSKGWNFSLRYDWYKLH